MIIKKQNHIASLAQFIGSGGFNLSDKDVLQKSLGRLSSEMHRQHGFRIESMFAYIAGALGRCALIKQEDAGLCLVGEENINIPDYRLILCDNTSFLVEVKNCAKMEIKFRQDYIKNLLQYANINKLPLKVAIYWSKLKVWTLNSVEIFNFNDGKYKLKFDVAFAKSEMAVLGDRTIATLFPLKLRLLTDQDKTTYLDEDGQCEITFGVPELYCQSTLIEDEIESSIAFKLMLFGKWGEQEEVIISDNKVVSIDYVYSPIELEADHLFRIIGILSSIISASYDVTTVSGGEVQRLMPNCDPERFEVSIPDDYKGEYLPLWRFSQKPNENYEVTKLYRRL
ncbi:MAG: hypothetical protein K0R98_1916 [Rickettsiaceae bacterium]|jgi:Holliday junction resolvase|nr:hypothetical protein [Rickettsiaceae bacterium]